MCSSILKMHRWQPSDDVTAAPLGGLTAGVFLRIVVVYTPTIVTGTLSGQTTMTVIEGEVPALSKQDAEKLRDQLRTAAAALDAAQLAKASFYKRWFGRLILAIYGLTGVVALSMLSSSYMAYQLAHGKRDYFAVDPKGRLTAMQPVSDPVLSQGALLERVKVCVSMINDYNFVDYQKRLTEAQECFTDDGWNQFATALMASGRVAMIRDRRLIGSSIATGPAVIVNRGLRKGVYTWIVEMPVQLTFQGGPDGKARSTENKKLTITLVRTNETNSSVGFSSYVEEDK